MLPSLGTPESFQRNCVTHCLRLQWPPGRQVKNCKQPKSRAEAPVTKRTTPFTIREPLQSCVGSLFSVTGISPQNIKCWRRNDAWLIEKKDELQTKVCYIKQQGGTQGIVRKYLEMLEVWLWSCFSIVLLESLGTSKVRTSAKRPEGTKHKKIEKPNCLAYIASVTAYSEKWEQAWHGVFPQ